MVSHAGLFFNASSSDGINLRSPKPNTNTDTSPQPCMQSTGVKFGISSVALVAMILNL